MENRKDTILKRNNGLPVTDPPLRKSGFHERRTGRRYGMRKQLDGFLRLQRTRADVDCKSNNRNSQKNIQNAY